MKGKALTKRIADLTGPYKELMRTTKRFMTSFTVKNSSSHGERLYTLRNDFPVSAYA